MEAMNKKRYIKPEVEELIDSGAYLLAESYNGGTEAFGRQQDNVFTEEDDDYEE